MKTLDYDLFAIYGHNRKINYKHVDEIKKSIREFGYRMEIPILVTPIENELIPGKHIILDGQHRYLAVKEMGLEFSYTIVEGNKNKYQIEESILLYNISRDNLKPDDYLYIYRDMPEYKKVIELKAKTGFSTPVILRIYNAYSSNSTMYGKFKNGDYELPERGYNKILKVYSAYNVFENLKKPNFKGAISSYVVAFSSILSNDKIELDVLMDKLEKNPEYLEHRDRNSNVLILYKIYNTRNSNPVDLPANLIRV